jgi:hypothetical protein
VPGVSLPALTHRYGDVAAVRDLALEVKPTSLWPPSGAPATPGANVWPGVVVRAAFLGDGVDYQVRSPRATSS